MIQKHFVFCLCINNEGDRVFEKDILQTIDSNWCPGCKRDGYCYYIVPTVKHFTHDKTYQTFDYEAYLHVDDDDNVVIGNIFDNPELLSKVILNPYQMED